MKSGHRGGLWTRVRRRGAVRRRAPGASRGAPPDPLEPVPLHLSARWERIPGPASRGGAVVAAGVSLTLAIAMVVMLPLEYTARIDSGPAPIVLAPGTGLDVGATREAPPSVDGGASPGRDTRTVTSGTDSLPERLGPRGVFRGHGALRHGRSCGGDVPASPVGSPRDGVRSAPRTITAPFSGSATVAPETASTAQGYPSTSVGGTARDAVGTAIRFLITTIGGPDGNHAIVVRFPVEAAPEDLDAVVRVIGSFRLD